MSSLLPFKDLPKGPRISQLNVSDTLLFHERSSPGNDCANISRSDSCLDLTSVREYTALKRLIVGRVCMCVPVIGLRATELELTFMIKTTHMLAVSSEDCHHIIGVP